MKILLNGQKKQVTNSASLKDIVKEFCKDSQHIVAELNGAIVKSHLWPKQTLKEGDKLELVSFVGGG